MREDVRISCVPDRVDFRSPVVGPVIPYDLIRSGAPLEPGTLLPVPSRGLTDLGPFEAVFEIDIANSTMITRFNVTVLKTDHHPQQTASRGIKLKDLVK